MANKPVRVILDTNLWISFLIKKDYSKLSSLIVSGNVVLIFSQELLSEFLVVTKRPKFNKYFNESDVLDLLVTIDQYAVFINVKTVTTLCRDEKDNFLLSLAIDSNADYLVSGDNDLLEITEIAKTKITTMADFIQFAGASSLS